MKLRYALALVVMFGTACQKDGPEPREPEDPDWIKLQVPTKYSDEAAHAITGDQNKTLLVATNTQIFSSSDRGKTWQVSRQEAIRVWGLLQRNDTVFALGAGSYNQEGREIAVSAEAFTTNLGQTWQSPGVIPKRFADFQPQLVIGQAAKAGVTYRLEELTEPINANTYRVVGYEAIRKDANGQTKIRIPAVRRRFIHLHLDAENYLYLTASAYRFDATTGKVVDDKTREVNAVVYVSRRPMPQ